MFQSKSNLIAVLIVAGAVALAVFSVYGDSLTSDELSHIPAGYSYLTQQDMRINPEHPPLIKDFAAMPLLFENLKIDINHSSWTNEINGQWNFGRHFMYEIGNNPDAIVFSARLAILIIFILLCWIVYTWAKEKYGEKMGLIVLTLTALSPNILAHARYVTTDVGAALGFVLATYYFIKFVNQPSAKNILWAGLSFGLAQLLKFSLILLIPLYGFTLLVYLIAQKISNSQFGWGKFFNYIGKSLVLLIIGFILIWPVYQFNIWHYPPERQKHDTETILAGYSFKPAAQLVIRMTEKPLLRPYAQYVLGLLMVFQRTGGGNTTYYLGDVAATAWKSYFPVVYLLKETLPVLILELIALVLAIRSVLKSKKRPNRLSNWIANNFAEFTWLSFIFIYWASSINGNLNIGIRHVLPTFPFFYLLTAGQIQKWLKRSAGLLAKTAKGFLVSILLVWLVVETISIYPYYLAYFNELAGGPVNGYKYAVDSNLDWGQDLKRLKGFMDQNKIEKIRLDYFGGGDPKYYLGDKYERLDSGNLSQRTGWLAVSATFLQNGRGQAAKGYSQDTTFYNWLNKYEPVTKIGYSIFVYKID